MNHKFKFNKGRLNVEKIRVNINDPIKKGKSTVDPSSLNKIELLIGDKTISSASNEITWSDNVIQLKPSITTLNELPAQSYSEIVFYYDIDSSIEPVKISKGFTYVS